MAYHFGWSHEAVLNMPHWERQRWCRQISEINDRMNETPADRGRSHRRGGGRGHGRDDAGGGIVLRNPPESD